MLKIFYSLYFLIGLVNLVEAVKFPGFISKFLVFNPSFFLFISIGIGVYLKLSQLIKWNKNLFKLFSLLAVVSYFAAMLLGLTELNQHDNFVFSQYGLYFPQFSLIFVWSLVGSLLNIPKNIYQKYSSYFIFLIPLLLILSLVSFWIWPMNFFIEINKEDNLIEYITAFSFLAASALSFAAAIYRFKRRQLIHVSLLIVAGLIFLFVAGEEISWGQRLLNFKTPQQVAEINQQNELTLHNSQGFAQYVLQAYLILGIYGICSWIFLELNKHLKWLKKSISEILFFTWPLSLYFFQNLFYNLAHEFGHLRFPEWSETSEMILSFGILLHFLKQYRRNS